MLTEEYIKWCNFSNKKAVIQYSKDGEQIEIYDSAAIAQKVTGIKNISGCCRYERTYAGGYIWRYADDENNEFRETI